MSELSDGHSWTTLLGLFVVTLFFTGISFFASQAMTPLSEESMSNISGRDGFDLSFDMRVNYDSTNSQICCDGGIKVGGAPGNVLHQSGNAGFLSFYEIYGHVLWDNMKVDLVTTNSQGYLRLNMNDLDAVSGTMTVDQVGVTDSRTSNPDNLAGAVTMNGTFDFSGSIYAWGH